MNENTLVAVCGYAGDANQVRDFMPLYLNHQCPVLVLSPVDSPIVPGKVSKKFGVRCAQAGKRAYIGSDSWIRQRKHLEIMLRQPQNFILANDSDSFCLDAKIPRYVYDEPGVLWSCEVSDLCHTIPEPYSLPRLAFQPPYFMSKQVLAALLKAAPSVGDGVGVQLPYIDHYMMRLAVAAGVPHKNYRRCVSCPSSTPETLECMRNAVRNEGAVFVHSVKKLEIARMLVQDRNEFLRSHPGKHE